MPTAPSSSVSGEIAGYARAAGIPESQIPTAVAIALAESGGNPRAYNGVGGDRSYGWWQINMIGAMGPDRRAKLGISSNEALFDKATNARAMAMISNRGTNWRPWTTYTGGRYRQYLSTAPGSSGPLDPVETKRKIEEAAEAGREEMRRVDPTGISEKVGDLAESFRAMTETFRRQSWNWLIIFIAIVLIILGVMILNRARLKKAAKIGLDIVGAIK